MGCMRRRVVIAQERSPTLIKAEGRWDDAVLSQPHLPCKVDPGYPATVIPAGIPDTFWGCMAHLGQGGRMNEDPYEFLEGFHSETVLWHTPDVWKYQSRGGAHGLLPRGPGSPPVALPV